MEDTSYHNMKVLDKRQKDSTLCPLVINIQNNLTGQTFSMKIQNILAEDFGGAPAAPATPSIKFKDLNTLQVRTLQRMADGQVDVDSANENEYDIMADLVELGLLDQEYQLTKAGQNAVAIAKKIGGSAELLDARKKQQAMSNFDRTGAAPDDVEVDGVEFDDADGEPEEEDEFKFDLGKGRPAF